tara:strand:+ start:244 stop:498 length:255 start_codon:yes stop_codon:yes gene_type:complete
MNRQRWAQLSGLDAEQPLLMLEGNQPFYKEELAEMIREEIQKAIEDVNIKKDISSLNLAKKTKSLTTSMGFAGIGFASSVPRRH